MDEKRARAMLSIWAAEPGAGEKSERPRTKEEARQARSMRIRQIAEDFIRRNLITLLVILSFALEGWAVALYTEHRVTKEVTQQVQAEMRRGFQNYLEQQEQERQAAAFLSGEASREAFMNQEFIAGAKLIAQEANDQVKGTKLGVALARVENKNYPGTIQEVAEQPNQWMFYSPDNKYTEHDLEIAEMILRPYYESGIMPNGLNENMVYFEWSGATGTARDSYQTTTSMSTWRWQG